MAAGVLIGITIAEGWRRAALHDSYANYLPAAATDGDMAPDETPPRTARRAVNRLWSPIAASAKRDLARLRHSRSDAARTKGEIPTT
jgi:hypothetical protein